MSENYSCSLAKAVAGVESPKSAVDLVHTPTPPKSIEHMQHRLRFLMGYHWPIRRSAVIDGPETVDCDDDLQRLELFCRGPSAMSGRPKYASYVMTRHTESQSTVPNGGVSSWRLSCKSHTPRTAGPYKGALSSVHTDRRSDPSSATG